MKHHHARALPSLLFLRDALSTSSDHSLLNFCSWKSLLTPFPFTAAALLGAGTFGALFLLRQLSPASFPPLSWLGRASQPESSDSEPRQVLFVPGLRNEGNNCFLNAILQALASSGCMLSFLTVYGRDSALTMFKGVESSCPAMPLTEALLALLEELSVLDIEPRVGSPHGVMLALELYVRQFDLAAQQDAAEALTHLASALQEEHLAFFRSCRAYVQSFFDASRTCSDGGAFDEIHIDMRNGTEKNAFHIWKQQLHWPMEGSMGSSLTCQECGFQFSTQFQSFHDVPLSPPQLADGNVVTACTIESCLERFTAPEDITHVRCSRCSHISALRMLRRKERVNKVLIQKIENCTFDDDCSCETLMAKEGEVWRSAYINAFKQLRFGRCPEVLCFHVQRAIINSSGDLIKWTGHVSFPLMLDLSPYTISAQGYVKSKFLISPQVQVIGQREAVQKLFWDNKAFGLQGKDEPALYRVASTDESASDDTHLSTSSESEDLASDSSFEGMSRKGCDEITGNPEESSEHILPETGDNTACINLRYEDVASENISQVGHSLVSTAVTANRDTACKQVLPGLPASSILGNDSITNVSNLSGVALQSNEDGDHVTGFDPSLQMVHHFNPFMFSLMAAGTAQNYPLASMPVFSTGNGQSLYRERSSVAGDSKTSETWLYELISVVVHHGNPRNGHYTVYRKAKAVPKHADSTFSANSIDSDNLQQAKGLQDNVVDSSVAMDSSDDEVEECSALHENMNFEASDERVGESVSISPGPTPDIVLSALPCTVTCMEGLTEAVLGESGGCVDAQKGYDRELVKCQTAKEETAIWFRVSDSHVDVVMEDEVLMAQATLLFYERCCKRASINHMPIG